MYEVNASGRKQNRDVVTAVKMQEIFLLPKYMKYLLRTLPCVHAIGCVLDYYYYYYYYYWDFVVSEYLKFLPLSIS